MSLKTDTTIRRRLGRSQQRAAAHVDRRRYSAGRDIQYRRRETSPPIFGTEPPDTVIVITQVRTLPTVTISRTTSRSTTRRSTSTSKSSSSSSSSQLSTSSSSPPSPTTTTFLPPATTTNPTSPSVSSSSSPTQSSENSNSPNPSANGGLSSGAIAGIAIAVVIILAALIAVLVRRRMMANRAEKRTNWLDRAGFTGPPPVPFMAQSTNPPYFPPPPAPEPYDYGTPRLSYSQPVPPPPAASNVALNPNRPASLVPGRRTTEFSPGLYSAASFQSSAVPISVPVVPPPPPPPPPPPVPAAAAVSNRNRNPLEGSRSTANNGLTVRCTFIPSMSDELPISTGETIGVLQEFDDGWALCVNGFGQQGMVPMECLEVPVSPGPGLGDRLGMKRSSSLSARS
ncbi:hypothetical protein E1B28_009252 [Marasmius oreades]|uniref:SH3 domain-containing protein n=1 Tax=Marasmius oreades TaxID=181124 RepID=A0A9P7S0Q4_9AGAR|nr:uncharacterized protein E1B28_009252 [Marasmius oreades]KAG7092950.1 hypothetical protein E1B28_009252 [Marasmius oreades]